MKNIAFYGIVLLILISLTGSYVFYIQKQRIKNLESSLKTVVKEKESLKEMLIIKDKIYESEKKITAIRQELDADSANYNANLRMLEQLRAKYAAEARTVEVGEQSP